MSMIRIGLRRLAFVSCVAAASLAWSTASPVPAAAAAADVPGPQVFDSTTRDALQSIITKQLAAFGREDASEAESFASPQLRDKFPDPSGFLAMVKQNYAALVHPRSTHFEETSDSPHGPLQKMTVVATDGSVWSVVYAFEKIGGEWRISGCGMMKQESQDI